MGLFITFCVIVTAIALPTFILYLCFHKIEKSENKYSIEKKPKQHDQWTEDWVYNANARQNNRYEYSDPIKEPKWTYNERARMWVDEEQLEEERHRQAYEENRRRWKAYEEEEAERERTREQERQLERENAQLIEELHKERKRIILTEEEKELSKKIKVQRSKLSFEEWKEEQRKKKI